MEVTYKINLDDYQAYVRHANQNSRMMRDLYRRRRYLTPLFAGWFVLTPAVLFGFDEVFVGSLIASFVLFTLFWVAGYPQLYRKQTDAYAKKILGEGRNAGFLCEHRMSIDEAGLSTESELAQARVSWAMVERVEETKEHIFIYVASMTAYIIPKWAFDSIQKAEDFFHAAQAFQRKQ
ncbi:MAG TPA: YcxB family protein [Pyrinomonadaceae bacterium]|nr:YcxB family protein [Pyrinomonadaceae bacterium]